MTGKVTIGQWPNAPLLLFLACAATDWTIRPSGAAGQGIRLVGAAALFVWAIDEVARGVNPWRRALGAVVLVIQAWVLL